MQKKYALGIDLGGSKIYTLLANRQGKVLAEIKLPTDATKGSEAILKNFFFSLEQVLAKAVVKKETLVGIGLGLPGPVDFHKATTEKMPNLPGCEKINFKRILQRKFKVPIFIENDANLAALAESRFGAGRKADSFLYLTISTGIGGGIILNKKLYRGRNGAAGEFGHMIVQKDGPICGCGQKGCLEALASGSAIERLYGISAETLGRRVRAGDPKAKQNLETVIDNLGIGLANLVNIFNPQLIIIGGGISQLGDLLFPLLCEKVRRYSLCPNSQNLKIVPARLGERIGALGAAIICFFG